MYNMNTKSIYNMLAHRLWYVGAQTSMKDCHIAFGIALGYSSGLYPQELSNEELTRYQELAKIIMQQTELNIVKEGWI